MGTTRRPGGCIATSSAAIITTTATTAAAATTVQMKRECVKVKESNIFIYVKKDLFGCFRIEKNVTKTITQV